VRRLSDVRRFRRSPDARERLDAAARRFHIASENEDSRCRTIPAVR
jgi:hypothetical protein